MPFCFMHHSKTGSCQIGRIYAVCNLSGHQHVQSSSLQSSSLLQNWMNYKGQPIGFKEIPFQPELANDVVQAPTIRVVLVEPGRLARIAEVGTALDAMQRTVGGCIEAYYPFEEQVCIVCNEEGKINGLPLNRAIRDADTGDMADIIAGTFFICDCSGESFGSLSTEQQKRYLEKYRLPERFFRSKDGIESAPYKPQNRER